MYEKYLLINPKTLLESLNTVIKFIKVIKTVKSLKFKNIKNIRKKCCLLIYNGTLI